jgi:hypothetical protein
MSIFDVLFTGRHENGDDDIVKIAEGLFKNGGWATQHPLTKNW